MNISTQNKLIIMKRTLAILFLLTALLGNINAQRTFALLAGVSNYGDTAINLRTSTKDVKELRQVLNRQQATVSTLTGKHATRANIVKHLEAIVQLAQPEDKIFFFFSGHGSTGCIYTYGPEQFAYSELINILSKAKTKQAFCFVDACKAGSVASIVEANYWLGEGTNDITFMMSCRPDELSFENQWVGNSLFTQALLKGLRGKADKNSDRSVTVEELFNYVYSDVTTRLKGNKRSQHPQFIGSKDKFDVVLTKW